MAWKNRWIVPALFVGAALAYSQLRRQDLHRMVANFRRYSMPSADLYDTITAPIFGGFFSQIAREIAQLAPGGSVLEVGSGPGRLAVKIAETSPDLRVTGLDISPDMVEMANALATRAGVADRVTFQLGDVAALPFPDASFDAVVSTFSFHHWPDRAGGLTQIYRVLRPGGIARIYDVAVWIRQFERKGPSFGDFVRSSPFGTQGAWIVDHLQYDKADVLEGFTSLTHTAVRLPRCFVGEAVLARRLRLRAAPGRNGVIDRRKGQRA